MKIKFSKSILVAAAVAAVGSAHALTFEILSVVGSQGLEAGWSAETGEKFIDFSLPNANVGDFQPSRFGTVVITFKVKAATPIVLSQVNYFLLGGVSGSGSITYSEVVEKADGSAILGVLPNVVIDTSNPLPVSGSIKLSEAVSEIKIKKTITMQAPNTDAYDLASLALVEQTFVCVPEPGSMLAIAAGMGLLVARRRRTR